jgi:3-keto-L-gulonate-6-phosphate decarboxylase
MDVKTADVGKVPLKCKADSGADLSRIILVANGTKRTMAGIGVELVGRE